MRVPNAGFIVYAVTEGGPYKVRRGYTLDEFEEAIQTCRLPDEPDKLEGWIGYLELVDDHDFRLGGPRDT